MSGQFLKYIVFTAATLLLAGCNGGDSASGSGVSGKSWEKASPAEIAEIPIPEVVFVKGGTFMMGCVEERDGECEEDELPAHEVSLSDFGMGKYEVTNAQYLAFLNANIGGISAEWFRPDKASKYDKCRIAFSESGKYEIEAGYEQHPVVGVSWLGATAYTEWLSGVSGEHFRLPTEAEWEYAARGGVQSKGYTYAGSNELDEIAWYAANSQYQLKPVGLKKPNELGIHDLNGNVLEWCADVYRYYSDAPVKDPLSGGNVGARVVRGGSAGSSEKYLRLAYRRSHKPTTSSAFIGFRIVRKR